METIFQAGHYPYMETIHLGQHICKTKISGGFVSKLNNIIDDVSLIIRSEIKKSLILFPFTMLAGFEKYICLRPFFLAQIFIFAMCFLS